MIKHWLRIVLVVAAVAIYAPILVASIMREFGPDTVQEAVDFFTRGCGERCGDPTYWIDLGLLAAFAITLPFLAWMGVLWIRRSRRADRRVGEVRRFFATAPERVPPAAIDEEVADRKFYRDRSGRLRPLEHHEAPGAD